MASDLATPTDAADPPSISPPETSRPSTPWRALSLLSYVILPPSFWPGLDSDGKWNASNSSSTTSLDTTTTTTTPGRSKSVDDGVATLESGHRRALSDTEVYTRTRSKLDQSVLGEGDFFDEPEEEGAEEATVGKASILKGTQNSVAFPISQDDEDVQASSTTPSQHKHTKSVSFQLPPPSSSATSVNEDLNDQDTQSPVESNSTAEPDTLDTPLTVVAESVFIDTSGDSPSRVEPDVSDTVTPLPTSTTPIERITPEPKMSWFSYYFRRTTFVVVPTAEEEAVTSRSTTHGQSDLIPEEETPTATSQPPEPTEAAESSTATTSALSFTKEHKDDDQEKASSVHSLDRESDQGSVEPNTPPSHPEDLPVPEGEPEADIKGKSVIEQVEDKVAVQQEESDVVASPIAEPAPIPSESSVVEVDTPKKSPLEVIKKMDGGRNSPHLPGWYPPTPSTFATEGRPRASFDSELVLDDVDGDDQRRESCYFDAPVVQVAKPVGDTERVAVEDIDADPEERTPTLGPKELEGDDVTEELELPQAEEEASDDKGEVVVVVIQEEAIVSQVEEEPKDIAQEEKQDDTPLSSLPIIVSSNDAHDPEVATSNVAENQSGGADEHVLNLQSSSSTIAAVDDHSPLIRSTQPFTEEKASDHVEEKSQAPVVGIVAGTSAIGAITVAADSRKKTIKSILRPLTPTDGSKHSLEKSGSVKIRGEGQGTPEQSSRASSPTPVKEKGRERKTSFLSRRLTKRSPALTKEDIEVRRKTWMDNYVGSPDPSSSPTKQEFPTTEPSEPDIPIRKRTLSKRRRYVSMSIASVSDYERMSAGGSTASRGIHFPSGSLTHEPLLGEHGEFLSSRVRKDSTSGKRKLHKPSPLEKEWRKSHITFTDLPATDEGYTNLSTTQTLSATTRNRRSILGRSLSLSIPSTSKQSSGSPLSPLFMSKPKSNSPPPQTSNDVVESPQTMFPTSDSGNGNSNSLNDALDSSKKVRPRFKSFRRSLSTFGSLKRPLASPELTEAIVPFDHSNHDINGNGHVNESPKVSQSEGREVYQQPNGTGELAGTPEKRKGSLSRLLGTIRRNSSTASTDSLKKLRKTTKA